ncbi:carbohydrate binding family 9 domain-containing protein [Gemmatimonas phototrophica]|uniref:carbohydrate binding family 9 domain-containing protein n=1 Tax=Gemmatimonas phototrophica TaxID=1379270 RepID=UPI0006A70907|nr:carbohydrate binding family 9 domain-containing protein [Gemmatimonas phototrophica]
MRKVSLHLISALLALPLLAGVSPRAASAQTPTVPEPTEESRRRLVARRALGRITVDGRLDEADWRSAPVAGDFAQARPDFLPTTRYPTEVRVLYDNEHLYVAAFNRDSAGMSSLRMPDLRRDFEPPENDVFGVTIGPMGDRRTVLQFSTTPLGSQADVQAFDGGDAFNFNWDALWRVRTTRADSGWIAEFAIPWRSLRYAPGLTSWDINFVRNTRRVAQWSAWMPYPRQLSSWRISYGGVLDSIQPPPPRTNVRVRPYVLGQRVTDKSSAAFNGSLGDVGGEVIWAPTANSLFEATVNTDFAQADVDRQVVNLTRFNVFLPERRQFFLENADLLNAGGLGSGTIGGIGGVSGRYFVQPFFTRRIGLGDDGTPQPIDAGARYAYRSGRTTAGALAMRTAALGTQGATTFGVVRGSQFFGRSTRLGSTLALRDGDVTDVNGLVSGRRNVMVAVDALSRIGELTQFTGMLSASNENGRTGLAGTYGITRNTATSLVGVLGAVVTKDYNPQMGFVSRPDVVMTNPFITWTLQPRRLPTAIVWLRHGPNAIAFNDPQSGALQEANVTYSGEVLFRNGATISPAVEYNVQRPTLPVTLFPNVQIAPGDYSYQRGGLTFRSDQSAKLATTLTTTTGAFFDGSLDRAELTARWSPSPYVSVRGAYEVNRLRSLGTRDSSFITHLAGPELRVFLNPRIQWSAFYQYNTAAERATLNARFSWEFLPLSFLYIVYNDRQAVQSGNTPLARSLIVKLSWLGQL